MKLKLFIATLLLTILELSAKHSKESTKEEKKTDSRTVYDQRQTGKYNVHVNIKDVQFFSLSDSISSLGDYGSYDYGDYGSIEGIDGDYDISHLTVNPIFAFLGSHSKPTKPSTTTTKAATEKIETNNTETTSASQELSSSTSKIDEASTTKQDVETTVKQENIANSITSTTAKPAFDYEEIPVEVQYYRTNQSKLPLAYTSAFHRNNVNNRPAINLKRHRRPSVVQILDGRNNNINNNNNNVKIIESDEQERTVKICGRGEFRDVHGRCRLKISGRNNSNPGLRRIFNVLSSIIPKEK